MHEWDIWPPAGSSRIPAWARQGAGAFPQPAAGGTLPQSAQAASPIAGPPSPASPPAGGGSVPTIGNVLQFLDIVPAPFIDLPGLQGVFGTKLPDELGPKLPPDFTSSLVEATPAGK